jgi:microcystin-dependent protein
MPDPYIGEIRIFPFNFAPFGWAMCNGQILPISQNTALFSIIGTNFGGNGTSTFALPDFEGNVPVCVGTGPGLSAYDLGQFGGGQTVTLLDAQNAIHNHAITATSTDATSTSPANNIYARGQWKVDNNNKGAVQTYASAEPKTNLNMAAIGNTGGGGPHNNLMPYLTLNFCIALAGEFPPRG